MEKETIDYMPVEEVKPQGRFLKVIGFKPKTAPIIIGKNCFVGCNTLILKGVAIGDNSTVGAGSVVTKNIPANVIAAGNPAKVIKMLETAE